jgi:hypothetical protein
MIKELIPLLKTHRLDFRAELKDEYISIYVIPKVLNEKLDDKDKAVLERPICKRYTIAEFTNEQLVEDIHAYANVLIEGTDAIEQMDKDIKARLAEKSKPATKRATNGKKAAPRKTKKQQMDEAREKQAKERENDTPPEPEEENRLGEKTPVKNKAELKTAAEKAQERVTQKQESPKEDDPLGLDELDLDL